MSRALFAILCVLTVFEVAAEESDGSRPSAVRELAFSPDGSLLAACGSLDRAKGKLLVWETDTFASRWEHAEPIGFSRLAFSPNGKQLALARAALELKLFDSTSGAPTGELKGHMDVTRAVAYTPTGDRIITGSYDTSILVWDASSLEIVSRMKGHTQPVFHIAVSPDGKRLASADSRAGQVFLWDLETGAKVHTFENLGSLVPHVAFSGDGRLLAVSSWTGGVTFFDTQTFSSRLRMHNVGGANWSELSQDGRWLAVATNGFNVLVFPFLSATDSALSNRVTQLIEKFKDESYDVREKASQELATIGLSAYSEVRSALESPLPETRVRARQLLRRFVDRESAVKLAGHEDEIECVTFSPDGRRLASGDQAGNILVWNVGDWKVIAKLSLAAGERGTLVP